VEWQLRVAAGEPLPVAQSQLSINGWAFEARVYAEDVEAGFLPATGTMSHLKFPSAARIDTGIRQGDTITPYYDPMISKVIVHAPTREQALNGLQQALLNTQAAGSVTNIRFLAALCTHPDFASGIVDTGLIERDISALTEAIEPPQSVTAIAAIAALGLTGNTSPFSGFTLWQPLSRMVSLKRTDSEASEPTGVTVETLAPDRFAVSVGDDSLDVVRTGDQYRINGSAFAASVFVDQQQVTVFSNGTFSFEFPDALAAADNDGAGGDQIVAPMPGLIKVVSVKAGDIVTQGEALLVLEAMKMEHTLTAPRDGVISDVPGVEEAQVEAGTVLVRLETEEQ
jgi:3-methylcrotonyl-CoA carboxylase alpha subunit